jgi:hypothetical protein
LLRKGFAVCGTENLFTQGEAPLAGHPDDANGGGAVSGGNGGNDLRHKRTLFPKFKLFLFYHVTQEKTMLTFQKETPAWSKIYSSSLRTAKKASVGTCTVPRERIFFLPPPQNQRFCRDSALDSNGQTKPAHFKVSPSAKHLTPFPRRLAGARRGQKVTRPA